MEGGDGDDTITGGADDDTIDGGDDEAYIQPDGSAGDGTDVRVTYNPTGRLGNDDSKLVDTPPVVILAHELVHASDIANGTATPGQSTEFDVDGLPTGDTVNNIEADAVGIDTNAPGTAGPGDVNNGPRVAHPGDPSENSIRDDLGLDPRNNY